MIILWTVGESWPWEAAVCVQSVYSQCTGVQSVGARAGAWERASCAWPGLGAWLCLARARWRRPDSPGQSVSWLRGQGTHRVLSVVSGCQSPSHLQTSGSWAECCQELRADTSDTQVWPGQWPAPASEGGASVSVCCGQCEGHSAKYFLLWSSWLLLKHPTANRI